MYPHSYRLLLVGCNLTFVQKNRRSGASPIPGFVLNCYVIVMIGAVLTCETINFKWL